MSQSITELGTVVGRILEITERGKLVIDNHKRRRIQAAQIIEVSHYAGDKDLQEAAREVKRRFVAEITEAAENEGREMKAKMARELEALRAILPSLAARAAIEAGAVVRHMEAED